MEIVVQILMLFVAVATVLRLSFARWSYALGISVVLAVFVLLTNDLCSQQTKAGIEQYMTVRQLRENAAIFVTLESFLFIAFAFARLERRQASSETSIERSSKLLRWGQRLGTVLLDYYPGVLILPVLFYLQTTLLFALPGVAFSTVSYALAIGVVMLVPTLRYVLRWAIPERELRLEIFFLVALIIFILGTITSVDEHIRQAPEVDMDLRGGLIALGIFGLCFVLGAGAHCLKSQLKRLFKRTK